jgi:tol-pal system protein YbgF
MKPNTILAALLLLSGSTHVWAAPAPVSEAANTSAGTLEERIAQLERMMKTRNLLQIELQQQLNLLQDEVSQVRGVTEEQSYKLEKVLQRQRELYQEIENRVSKVYEQSNTSVAATTAIDTSQAVSDDLSENEAYDRAVALIMQDKRYDAAIPEFQNFLASFPQSVYIPNAHYWLGQLLTIKNDDANALEHFKLVVEKFPESNKRPDAMLKLGTLYEKLEKLDLAKQILNTLIAEYPSTTAAKLATERLAKI